jgi:hypothetical protein
MPVDSENVKKAIDAFVDDDYMTSKEILKKEVKNAKNDWMRDKLGLDNDLEGDKEEFDDLDLEDENTEKDNEE